MRNNVGHSQCHHITCSIHVANGFILKEVLRRDWMFKLVGKETFPVGRTGAKATINIEALTGFTYEYTLEINGKSLQTFIDNWAKISMTWLLKLDGADCRIVLGKREKSNAAGENLFRENAFRVK